ncbi:hypothetical protein Scep_003046 [Stephania cephalantha]|uniref:Beta-Casp domain-containing protein n=1 Tax=Stephania cephalantha TaxID=152367 RepID=A0AAP0LC63_9MAGN
MHFMFDILEGTMFYIFKSWSLTCFGITVAVSDFDRSFINAFGPCILFASPGMISGGFSLEVFKQWAPSEKNLIALPG